MDYPEYVTKRDLGDGRSIWLVPQLFGNVLICIGPNDQELYSDQWQYQNISAAIVAFVSWLPDKQAEPDGWYRHPTSGRRRPDGDPAREYVHQ